ncbi:hypothetical protein Ddye_017994 [Dipteronia dyeriana]|uniref:NTF2 domain-containing protein n=1 Tax=Dipteronia dyeriana TaxID=168575 RepID=A0AAD9X1U9_9ROSI|nr:hypothetical protein Ddye_017994 [Dipteronia dyeriana]
MAAPMQQAPTTPTADIVGNAFVHQYYLILHQSPALVHRFYQDASKLGRPEEDGAMSITTTMQLSIKILSLDYGEFSAEITTVDAQESYNGGVLVLVTGSLTGKDNVRRKFTQSFFLAPQDKGYFVLNDVFRYVDNANHGNQASIKNVEAPITPDQDVSPVQENHVPDQTAVLSEEINEEEVYNPSENGDGTVEEEEAPVAEGKVMKDSSVSISSSPTQASMRDFVLALWNLKEEIAVQRAIEASPILVSGCRVVGEPKKSTRGKLGFIVIFLSFINGMSLQLENSNSSG